MLNNGFKHVFDALASFAADSQSFTGIQTDDIFNLGFDPLWFCRGQIDLVEHRNDFMIVFKCQIHIGQRLRLNTLAGINEQKAGFTRSQTATDFISEINVTWRVD